MNKILATLALVAMTGNAMAADVTGVWSTHKDGCAWRKNQDTFPKDFEDISYLTKDSVTGWEWGCDFLSSASNKFGQTVHVSACAMEGTSWADLLLVEKSYTSEGFQLSTKENEEPLVFPYKCE